MLSGVHEHGIGGRRHDQITLPAVQQRGGHPPRLAVVEIVRRQRPVGIDLRDIAALREAQEPFAARDLQSVPMAGHPAAEAEFLLIRRRKRFRAGGHGELRRGEGARFLPRDKVVVLPQQVPETPGLHGADGAVLLVEVAPLPEDDALAEPPQPERLPEREGDQPDRTRRLHRDSLPGRDQRAVREPVPGRDAGLSVPDAGMLVRIAGALDTTVNDLLGEEEPEQGRDLAAELEALNRQLAEREERSRRRWRAFFAAVGILALWGAVMLAAGLIR